MSLSIGIVGLPNVGKSTLFNALTKKSVLVANYPFATIDPSVGVVAVPDTRLWKLSEFSKSKKTVPAIVEFVDIAGLVKGASEGEGLGNKFLQNIRETDAILELVRIFEDENIIHVDNKINPLADIEVVNLELILSDVETVSKRLAGLTKDVKSGKKEAIAEEKLLSGVLETLKKGELASSISFHDIEKIIVKGLHLLTAKPILYCLNKKSGGKNLDEMGDPRYEILLKFFKENNAGYVVVDAGIENELKDFEGAERELFRKELVTNKDDLSAEARSQSEDAKADGINDLIKKSYEILNLITYFTTGEDETRAWTIIRGSTAPVAGQAIHTDFRDKFIRAEVIHWDSLLDVGSYAKAREKGLVRTEGKEYVVKDGDVVEFLI